MKISSSQKKENFTRLARKRTAKVIDTLKLLKNLSRRSNYEYTDEQVNEMEKAIKDQLKETFRELKSKSTERSEKESSFEFSGKLKSVK
tara:strand:- start:212 stop:478 length:267 start_codon:yes stop_codon:yes gene_type:complete